MNTISANIAKISYSTRKAQPTMRILLVEDHSINRELLSEYLKLTGYEVLSLENGSTFFEAIEQFQPHVILLDLKLPGVDGYTLLEQIKQNSEWQNIPVIVVSAFAFNTDQQRALDLGACKYLVKPVHLNTLQEAIQEELKDLAS